MERRGFLMGALLGVVVGGGVAWLSSYLREEAELANAAARVAQAEEDLVEAADRANALADRAREKLEAGGGASASEPVDPSVPPKIGPLDPDGRLLSFAQQGEDLVLKGVLEQLDLTKPTYLDIGSYHPVVSNNTYLLYAVGGRGVLVEPNPFLAEMSRRVRPEDTMVEAGVTSGKRGEADYYVIQGRPQLNTFSKAQADRYLAEGGKIEKTVKMPMIPIDELLAEHFGESPPDLLSIDVEGLDLSVLQSMDFARWRPPVICVETLVYGSKALVPEIFDLLREQDYVVRGATFVNTIFVDAKRLAEPEAGEAKLGVG